MVSVDVTTEQEALGMKLDQESGWRKLCGIFLVSGVDRLLGGGLGISVGFVILIKYVELRTVVGL